MVVAFDLSYAGTCRQVLVCFIALGCIRTSEWEKRVVGAYAGA